MRGKYLKTILWIGVVSLSVIFVYEGRKIFSPNAKKVSSEKRYQCPMHPEIISNRPGNCPICNMPLQEVGHLSPPSQMPVQEQVGSTDKEKMVGNRAEVSIPTERQQLIGVTTEKVEQRELDIEIRTVGRVAFDPELYNAIAEYREAISAKERIKESPWSTAREEAQNLIRSSALKLRLLGLSEQQIRKVAGGQNESLNLLLPDKTVWVYAQVYEYEVDVLRRGQQVVVTTPSIPGRKFFGTIKAIDPVLNSTTRTVRVRAEIETPDERLRPETFVNIKIKIPLGNVLAVPEDAILSTGETQIAFVKKSGGDFEPREVTLGQETIGYYEVLSGLSEGEEVVTSANFLIDSESRFKAALKAFIRPSETQVK